MEIGFDVIGDLFLSPDDEFNWDGKATSLYCIVTGNISNDMGKLQETLEHLGECYKGVFYVSGSYEFENCTDLADRVNDINYICQRTNNVASLYHHVVILESIAILGCNGWTTRSTNQQYKKIINDYYFEDLLYLKRSVTKLQKHGDVKDMIVISNSVPNENLYFGRVPNNFETTLALDVCLKNDTENKIKYWTFGNTDNKVNITKDHITYLNNPYSKGMPYWPTRIEIKI